MLDKIMLLGQKAQTIHVMYARYTDTCFIYLLYSNVNDLYSFLISLLIATKERKILSILCTSVYDILYQVVLLYVFIYDIFEMFYVFQCVLCVLIQDTMVKQLCLNGVTLYKNIYNKKTNKKKKNPNRDRCGYFWACDYLSLLGLTFIRVSKRGHWWPLLCLLFWKPLNLVKSLQSKILTNRWIVIHTEVCQDETGPVQAPAPLTIFYRIRNSMKLCNPFFHNIFSRSQRHFAHVTTITLSLCV